MLFNELFAKFDFILKEKDNLRNTYAFIILNTGIAFKFLRFLNDLS